MILGDRKSESEPAGEAATTLDALFRRTATDRPDDIALADPPNRRSFMTGVPRRLSYAEADRGISAIAAQLRALGLPTDAVVGIQLPNIVECALAILGVLRAGLIAAPLPLLWRHAETAPVLSRLGAKAVITAGSVGGVALCEHVIQAAADVFSIRHICAFGEDLPDGVIPLDHVLEATPAETPGVDRNGNPAAHVAMITIEVTARGPVLVARNHLELIAGGTGALVEGDLPRPVHLLACCAMSSFAGLALTLLPCLLAGGTLSLHHGFDPQTFASQCQDDRCNAVVLPGPVVARLEKAGLLAQPDLKTVLALWRAPENVMASPAWHNEHVALTDMLAFGETALIGSRRGSFGEAVSLLAGRITTPREAADGMLFAETARTETGTLAVRGPMVPRYAFPPGAERSDAPHLKADAAGFVDTRYPCRFDPAAGSLIVTGPPPGIVAVGGYRFATSELEAQVRRLEPAAFVTALPDALTAQRLAGVSGMADEMRTRLAEQGANPLLADAFAGSAAT